MSDFGISHLAVGQADVMLGRVEASPKPIGGHSIPVGSVRPRNRVSWRYPGRRPSRPGYTTPPVLIVCYWSFPAPFYVKLVQVQTLPHQSR